jgi:hypothetical protein
MNKLVIAAVSGCAVVAMSALAFAQAGQNSAKPDPALLATMACRPSLAAEKPNAKVGAVAVICKSMPVAKMMMSEHGGPDLSKALSADQVDHAWRDFVTAQLLIRSGDGGG